MNLKTNLYNHQRKAVDKLMRIKVGALYMEMGTGKTRTALELINERIKKGKVSHVLWLCPCSVKENLRKDIIKHTGEYNKDLITICGIETLSSSVKTNLELLKLVNNKKCYLIVDESNLVKNHRARRTENIIKLSKFCNYKLILNGTPITRCEKDLFAQWYILDWRILGYKSFWSFSANHIQYDDRIPNKIIKCLNVEYLVRKIAGYSYQVKKDECLDLPCKSYETRYYNISNYQRDNYNYVADELLFSLDEFKPYTIYRFLTALQDVIAGFNLKIDKNLKITKTLMFPNPLDNPRIDMLLNILSNIDDEKVIIFCKYTQEILDITNVLNNEYGEGSAVNFYGEINQKNRQKNINKFSEQSRFLVANKTCAGYGLNLQFCSYVIYYSNDWDYATRSQSEDRVHRIGQNKNVHVIDICANYTLDERILKCLNKKENLVDSFKEEIERVKDRKDLINWIK